MHHQRFSIRGAVNILIKEEEITTISIALKILGTGLPKGKKKRYAVFSQHIFDFEQGGSLLYSTRRTCKSIEKGLWTV